MKDATSSTSSRTTRATTFARRRPSSHGVAKSRRAQVHVSPNGTTRRVPGQRYRADALGASRVQVLAVARDIRLLEEEYHAEVLKYMYHMEQCTMSSATQIDQQPDIKWEMRPQLVDFLVEAHLLFKLRPETLYLTLNIIDRYCSRRVVFSKHYQLVGCAALWLAAKFEDAKERVPTVHDLREICCSTYELNDFIQMEEHLLTTIQWVLGHPTAEAWLRLTCCTVFTENVSTGHVARFLMEITLFHREFIPFTASSVSSGALILAQSICGNARRPSDEKESALDVAELLHKRLSKDLSSISEILVKKYGYAFYSKASSVVVQFYMGHTRFQRHPVPELPPMTPQRTSTIPPTPPLSASTSCSSMSSDDMPDTPMQSPSERDSALLVNPENQKENLYVAEPQIKRDVTDDYFGHSRPALQTLNGIPLSPHAMIH